MSERVSYYCDICNGELEEDDLEIPFGDGSEFVINSPRIEMTVVLEQLKNKDGSCAGSTGLEVCLKCFNQQLKLIKPLVDERKKVKVTKK